MQLTFKVPARQSIILITYPKAERLLGVCVQFTVVICSSKNREACLTVAQQSVKRNASLGQSFHGDGSPCRSSLDRTSTSIWTFVYAKKIIMLNTQNH